MTIPPKRKYGEDDLISVLIENSEFAENDANAIIAAITAQTVVLNQLLAHLQTLPKQTFQPNIPTPTVQNTILNTSGREKLSKKLLATADWITTNDPDNLLSVRQIAQAAKVSIGTAQAAIKLIADERSK